MASMLDLLFRRPKQAGAAAMRSLRLAEAHEFPHFKALAAIALGRARAELENPKAGLDLLQAGLRQMEANGNRTAMTLYLHWLAEAWRLSGSADEALNCVERALSANPSERCFWPENLRLRADLWVRQGKCEAAEQGFREALAAARKMQAKIPELRAAASLARLLLDQGRDIGHELSAVLGCFICPPDCQDIREAKSVLATLAAPA